MNDLLDPKDDDEAQGDEVLGAAADPSLAEPSPTDPSLGDPGLDDPEERSWLGDDEYLPDPDDIPEERDAVAAKDAAALTRAAVIVSVVAILFFGLLALAGVPGMDRFARGFAIGCVVATVNLRLLANASWGVFNQRVAVALIGFLASFTTLIAVAVWLGTTHPDWVLGYGVGLSLPGAAGLYYAYEMSRAAKDKRAS